MARSGTPSTPGPRASKASAETQRALIDAAIVTLKADGFAGASARTIARRADCNQGLVFYHFGSVANLLLAALDTVSAERLARYSDAVAQARSLPDLLRLAEAVFEEDLDAGYVTVLVELISGARSIPGFGAEIATRLEPWTAFAKEAVEKVANPALLALTAPSDEVAYAVVALYLGLEMLTHLDGDHTNALALFRRARRLAALLGMLPPPASGEPT
ncbi:TetR family transcriptional regulator [Streptomyces tateyamensis]|uniref:TetR family transcriptional regulator n=1 Tax=Streptomyces tateyamensis TaxID=565073 RepID=A0A2V4MSF9_9ACTN|nr:TetR/AcrR family transcriptional regulator [Streptomyces tateyamensis]PYC65347.1 TetR family transcriptional regulator [Streptomyces tateyamensis]